MFSCKKWILGAALTAASLMGAGPVSADTEMLFTGGGIIREGYGPEARKITFSVDLFAAAAGQVSGEIQFHFHSIGDVGLDKSHFVANDFSDFYVNTVENTELGTFQFIRIEANGQLNGEDGWRVLARFTDFGSPVKRKEKSDPASDAVRIVLLDPYGEVVYDTAQDYPREQSFRTLLDGGNVTLYVTIDPMAP